MFTLLVGGEIYRRYYESCLQRLGDCVLRVEFNFNFECWRFKLIDKVYLSVARINTGFYLLMVFF